MKKMGKHGIRKALWVGVNRNLYIGKPVIFNDALPLKATHGDGIDKLKSLGTRCSLRHSSNSSAAMQQLAPLVPLTK